MATFYFNEKRRKWEIGPGVPTKYSLLCGLTFMIILYGHLPNLPIMVSCTVVLSLLYCINFVYIKVWKLWRKLNGGRATGSSVYANWNKKRHWVNKSMDQQRYCAGSGGSGIFNQDHNYLVNAFIVGFVLLSTLPSLSSAGKLFEYEY